MFLYSGLQDYLFYESEFNISGGDRVCHDIQLVNDTTPELTEHFRIFITASNSVTAPRNSLVYIYDDDGEPNSILFWVLWDTFIQNLPNA